MLIKNFIIALFLLLTAGIQSTTGQTPVPLGMEDVVWQKDELSVTSLAFSPIQPYVAVGTTSLPVLLDLNTGIEIKKFLCKNSITGLKFTNDGNYLFTGSTDGQLIKWNTQTWDSVIIDDITDRTKCINSIDYNEVKNIFATASDQYGCIIYDATTNIIIDKWQGMPLIDAKYNLYAVVNTVSIRHDGKVIAIGMKDIDQTWLYDIGTKTIIKKIRGEDGLYSPTKNELIVKKIKNSNGSELLNGLDYYKFDESETPINININILYKDIKFIFNNEGNKLIVTGIKSNIKFYDLLNIQNIKEFSYEQGGSFFFLSLSNNDDYLLAGNFGEVVLIASGDYLNVLMNNIHYFTISPNPTNDLLNIEYSLTQNTNIHITLNDLQGAFRGEIYSGIQEVGVHILNYPIQNLPSGTYFININVNGSISSKKFVIVN